MPLDGNMVNVLCDEPTAFLDYDPHRLMYRVLFSVSQKLPLTGAVVKNVIPLGEYRETVSGAWESALDAIKVRPKEATECGLKF